VTGDERPLLDADLLRQLERLRLTTLTAIVAGLAGDREGRASVARLEFADYRPYVAGDELRRIDWNIYRRLHQLVVKVGAEDGRLSLALLVDTSRSMRVGEPSKFRAAQRMTAALAAIALLRGDQAEVHALGDGRSRPLVRLDGPRQITALVRELERLPESHGTGLEAALADYARGGTASDIALLLSDAHVPTGELAPALRTLASCGRTAGLVHVVAGDERETLLRGPLELRDAESGRVIETTLDEEGAAEYAERFARFGDSVREQCRALGVRYLRVGSDEDPLELLLAHADEVAVTIG
jgi:uncharacterized protein (DUF58 family)